MVKNKKLKDLKKLLIQQKEKYGITESFSYRFDSRTRRLILCYTLPQTIRKGGEVKVKKINKEKYIDDVLNQIAIIHFQRVIV